MRYLNCILLYLSNDLTSFDAFTIVSIYIEVLITNWIAEWGAWITCTARPRVKRIKHNYKMDIILILFATLNPIGQILYKYKKISEGISVILQIIFAVPLFINIFARMSYYEPRR